MTYHKITIQVPEGLSKAKVRATVCGSKTAEKTVTCEAPAKKVLIQTDKPIYKPGQKGKLFSTSLIFI